MDNQKDFVGGTQKFWSNRGKLPYSKNVEKFTKGTLPNDKFNFIVAVEAVYWHLAIMGYSAKDTIKAFATYKAKQNALPTYRPTLTAWLVVESAIAIKRDHDITQDQLCNHLLAMYEAELWRTLWSESAWKRGDGEIVAPDLSLDAARVWAIVMGDPLPTQITRDDDADEGKRSADVVEDVAEEMAEA